MARIRTIKPELPHSESMGRVSRDARLLFMQLFTIVDDVGRARAASRLLASLLYPYDDDAPTLMDGWKSELEREGCIRLYMIDGTQYLQIVNWLKHQKIDHPSRSKFPGPSDMFASPREDVASPRASRARGLDLGPRTLDLDLGGEGSTREDARECAPPAPARKADDWPDDYREQFAAAYPEKKRMAEGLEILEGVRERGEVTWTFLMEKLQLYAAKTDDGYFSGPGNWLKGKRWNDQPSAAAGNGHAKPVSRPAPGDRARRLAAEVELSERQAAAGGSPDAVGGADLGGDDARIVAGAQRK